MEKRLKNGEQRWDKMGLGGARGGGGGGAKGATAPSGANEEVTVDEDQGQIQDLIGHFGKYQLLIFVFKILIGATSAFNNLGVTFFAPTDFVGYWCADAGASPPTPHMGLVAQTNGSTTGGYVFNVQPLYADPALYMLHNHTSAHHSPIARSAPQRMSHYHQVDYQSILSEFLFGHERHARHQQDNLNFDTPRNLRKECTYFSPADNKHHECTSFQYDTGIWLSTIIDEWDLVCQGRAWLVSLTQSLYMSGFIISFLVFGYLSDRFGRWRSLLAGALIEIVSGIGCAFASSVTWFMIFRFFLGLGNAGRSSSSYLIMIEWAGPKWRMHISTLGSLGWVMGYCAMPWITQYFLHFRTMQIFVCLYELIFVVWLLRLPESPRWLLTHRRFNEAYEVLLMAAKFNGLIKPEKLARKGSDDSKIFAAAAAAATAESNNNSLHARRLTALEMNGGAMSGGANESSASVRINGAGDMDKPRDLLLKPYTIEEFDMKFKRLVNTIQAKEFTQNEDKLSIIDLFKWENLRKYALILYFVWAANSFIYYGIVLRVGDFGGRNLFVAFTIAGLTELPSIAFTMLCMKFLPRKTTNLFIFATTGLLCAIQIPLKYYDYQWLQQFTIMLAKLFNSCSFTVVLYQTMELFPTSIRQSAYSSCSLAGRVGSILAPFIKELSQVTNDSVPPFIYAVLSLLSAILIKGLPETKGSDLPDTLLEAENFKGIDEEAATGTTPEDVTSTRPDAGQQQHQRSKTSTLMSLP